MKDNRGYRPCVRVIIIKGKEILLCKRLEGKEIKNYTFPGGGIEEGETIEESVVKECLEEVGVLVNNVQELGLKHRYEKEFDKPERAKLYRGIEDIWCVADFERIEKKLYGSQNDAMTYTWETPKKAIELFLEKNTQYSQGSIDAIFKASNDHMGVKLLVKDKSKTKLSSW